MPEKLARSCRKQTTRLKVVSSARVSLGLEERFSCASYKKEETCSLSVEAFPMLRNFLIES